MAVHKKVMARKKTNSGGDVPFRAPPRRRWLVWLRWLATVAVWGVVALAGVLAFYAIDLPDVDSATEQTRRPVISVRAADGSTLATTGDLYGQPVHLASLPPTLPRAVMATEDRRFYRHFGLDVIGLARAMASNVAAGRIRQGGSTITQQVAKNLFLSPERSLKRKVQELMLALWLEHKFSKDQILTLYLNRVYLGAGTYGVDAAARKYFGKPATAVDLYESAMLAGLLKAPSRYNPFASRSRAHARTQVVLRNMVAAGYLSDSEARRAARSGETRAYAPRARGRGRYFADWVMQRLRDYVTVSDSDLVVRTTLDPARQAVVEKAIDGTLKATAVKAHVGEAAAVVLAADGAVRAMVGGRSYAKSQFNRAVQARRQPGSAFKPFVYLAGLEAGLTPDTVMTDGPVDIDGWQPRNFDNTYRGAMSLTDAFALSVNTVAVKVSEKAGRRAVIDVARRFGLSGTMKPHPSLALGAFEVSPLELAAAYVPFANGGAGVWAYGIEEIQDGRGRVLYARTGGGTGRVADADDIEALHDMMRAVVSRGTARRAGLPPGSVGKTGTSQDFRDAWFAGSRGDLTAVVWMGNDDGAGMKGVTGGGLPARAWARIMGAAPAPVAKAAPKRKAAPPAPPPERNFFDKLLRALGGADR